MNEQQIENMRKARNDMTRFLMTYKFALDEMNTKLMILKEEFQHFHDYNPIEHIKSRIKSPESIYKKLIRKKLPVTLDSIQKNIHDIVGFRIVCSFSSDIYLLSEMIQNQKDITLVTCKDYIKHPKPNGYQSLHLIVTVPVYMSDREEHVHVELQIRTVAMDFWASLEHKIYYKYSKAIPENLLAELKETAKIANDLDNRMEKLHRAVQHIKEQDMQENEDDMNMVNINEERFHLPMSMLQSFVSKEEDE
ncbi:GTP pyrophosphokinase family protein [Virgibacillus sp. 179-BFC.A HS]|uniref:GTP pyrophosphokinase family protein n=1 Tax=Tigheibacillus jepli TaxID=3035914 RepID=A0ABU5CD18_9BACI|nr:GTP pyrophosphokinase family protein [Virgibacillus sp. 179-BFC.A HS]MDY0404105.1 GTP pyrophosphokinase family protein [Virgibacillus sp. 179-BFC.A HS]